MSTRPGPRPRCDSLLGLGVALGLILAAGCGGLPEDRPLKRGVVLIRMTDWQEPWFSERVRAWKDRGETEMAVESYQRIEDLPEILRRQQLPEKGGSFLLCKAEGRLLPTLAKERLILPMNALVDDMAALEADYLPEALTPARLDGKLWGIPRKLENHVFVHRIEAVGRAVTEWRRFAPELEKLFAKENGRGLPRDYELELDPADWDTWDLAVAGYVWSRLSIGGLQEPRLGHRTVDDAGTFVDLASRVFAHGGTPEELLAIEGKAVEDFLSWEALFLRHGIYPSSMIDPGWSVHDTHRGFKSGRLFAAPMHQLDALEFQRRYGEGSGDVTRRLGCAPMPRGASLLLDEDGRPVRSGAHRSHLAGWWWVIPAACPSPRKALALARTITSAEFHGAEAARFGMYPICKAVWAKLDVHFPSPWMREVLTTSRAQFERGCPAVPDDRLRHRREALRLMQTWMNMARAADTMGKTVAVSRLDQKEWLPPR